LSLSDGRTARRCWGSCPYTGLAARFRGAAAIDNRWPRRVRVARPTGPHSAPLASLRPAGSPSTTKPCAIWPPEPVGPRPAGRDQDRTAPPHGRAGIESASLGLPGAGPRQFDDVVAMVRHPAGGSSCGPTAAVARRWPTSRHLTRPSAPAFDACLSWQQSDPPLRGEWDLAECWRTEARLARQKEGLPVTYITEDTVRSSPDLCACCSWRRSAPAPPRLSRDTAGASRRARNLVEWRHLSTRAPPWH
jgi:hypothetical protein